MRKSSIQGFCTMLCKAMLSFCFLLLWGGQLLRAQAPVFTSTPGTTATVGQPYQYSVQATDPNNLPMTFSAGSLPSWLSFSTAGQSTSSQFGGTVASPGGVAGDAAGNIYVTELTGTKIYKIAPDGTMTLWYTRSAGYVYAMLVVGNDLLISYFSGNNNKITKVNLVGTPVQTTLVVSPALTSPLAMLERNGFLYVADYSAGKLRKVNLSTNVVSDVLNLSRIFGIGFNNAGTLYLASYDLKKLYTADINNVNPQSTLIEVLSLTNYISDVKIDANDNIYISGNGFVRKYDPTLSTYVSCWTGAGNVWGMSLTPGGTLVFGLNSANMVHRLQTGAVLSGTPALEDIGVHNVSLDVTNGTQTTNQSFTISVSGPSTFQTATITVPFGTAPVILTDPASNSGGAFTYTSNNNAVASVNGNILTIAGMGTATITATQAASGLYLQTPRTFTVTVTAPAPTFGSWPAISKLRNDAPFTLTAPTTNSTGNITYTSSNQQVATISGTTVTITGIGTATITASQAAAGNYAQGSTTTTLTVSSGVPTIGALTLSSKTYGDQPFVLTDPVSNSSGAFTYTSSNPQVATINGNMVTIVGVGNADITATQAAAGSFNSGSVTATLNVAPAMPAIGNWSIPAQTYGAAALQLTDPASNSNGAFSYTTSDASVAAVSGNTLTIVGVGTATITASQAAAGNYTGGSVQAVVVVSPANPVLGNLVIPAKTFGDAAFSLSAPASNSNGVFSYTSSNPAVVAVSGNTVTVVGAGTATITANQAVAAYYTSATTSGTVTVAKANPVITAPGAISKTFGDAAFNLPILTSQSSGTWSYTSSNTGVVSVSGNLLSITGAGSAIITATQAATNNYNAGTTTINISVAKANPVVSTPAAISKQYGDAAFVLAEPASNSTGAWSYASSNTGVATITGNTVTIPGAGNATITATQAATANYNAAQVSTTFTVAKAPLTITTANAFRCVNTANPAFTYSMRGFVNGENASVLTSQPAATTTASQNSAAGTYAITTSGAQAAHYNITYEPGVLTVNNPQRSAQRYPVVDAIAGESTALQARSFGTQYLWAPVTGLSNSRVAMTTTTLQKEQQYTIAITEATGCMVTDTVLVRTFSKPDVFVPNLFSPNGDGVNDELRINPVAMKQLYYFRVFDSYGKLLFETRNLNEGWNGRFRGELQRTNTYSWILSGRDKNGKWLTTSGSVTLVR